MLYLVKLARRCSSYAALGSTGYQGLKRLKGVGLQPETLADRLLVELSQPASKVETNPDKSSSG